MVETIVRNIDVVLFGEEASDFTFSVALAAVLGGWTGIVSTTSNDSLPLFDTVKKSIETNCASIKCVQPPIKEKWLCGIKPTETSLTLEGKVAWYQCPWISRKSTDTTGSHIMAFLNHMATKQKSGDYVLIGITTHVDYVLSYNLGDLLHFSQQIASRGCECAQYDFIGADDIFTK